MQNLSLILNNLNKTSEITGLKAEFETEGASFDDVFKLKQLAVKSNLKLEIKIGGSGAVRDLYECKKLNADIIVAPMVESGYALKKYVESVKSVYENCKLPELFINLETITGINNADKIFSADEFGVITGIVLGRGDLSASLNVKADDKIITEISEMLYNKTREYNKKLITGGKIRPEEAHSIAKYSDGAETRKIIFEKNINSCDILKAIEFEIGWIQQLHNKTNSDYARIEELTARLRNGSEIQNAV